MNALAFDRTLMLQAWLSPSYPVGAYAYSHALEQEIETRRVHDGETLKAWLEDLLHWGAGRSDAILMGEVYRLLETGVEAEKMTALADLAATATAMITSAEFRQESLQQGAAFLEITRSAWPHEQLEKFANQTKTTPYCICVAVAGASHGVEQALLVQSCLLAMASNWVSAAVRLNAIGQSEGQRLVAALLPLVQDVTLGASAQTLDTLGSCTFMNDIASFRHQTQASRLFRS